MRQHFLLIPMLALCLWALGCFSLSSPAMAEQNIFTISGIQVDIEGENAVTARNQAIKEAQRRGLWQLLGVPYPEKDADEQETSSQKDMASQIIPADNPVVARLRSMDDVLVESTVHDFSLEDERSAPKRYRATFTVRYQARAIEQYFSGMGLSLSVIETKPILIIPAFRFGASTLIWDDPNPWRYAWQEVAESDNLAKDQVVPLRLPTGDSEDQDLVTQKILTQTDKNVLARLREKYQVNEVLLAVARSKGSPLKPINGVDVRVYQDFGGVPVELVSLETTGNFHDAVKQTHAKIAAQWRARTVIQASVIGEIHARVLYNSHAQWRQMLRVLQELQVVSNVQVVRLSRNDADVKIALRGGLDGLVTTLEKRQILLTRGAVIDGKWHIIRAWQ